MAQTARRRTHAVWLAALALCAALAGTLAQSGWLAADTSAADKRAGTDTGVTDTPRRIGGRIEPTIRKISPVKGESRKQTIERVLKQEADLAVKLRPPLVFCHRVADGSIKVDGNLDERAWARAEVADRFRATRNLKPSALQTKAMLLWDGRYLYVGFQCDDSDVVATINKPDGDYWKEDTAEVFIDPDGDGMTYLEFEFSPRGLLYDGAIADYRPEIDWPADLEHLDIEGSARWYHVRKSPLAVKVHGTINKAKDVDRGWTCEFALSWEDIARGTHVVSVPPVDGDRWRIGLFHINNQQHGDAKFSEYNAWSPTTSWFHVPKLFGHVVFVSD